MAVAWWVRRAIAGVLGAGGVACAAGPSETPDRSSAAVAATPRTAVVAVPCDRRWAAATDGLWDNPNAWVPAGIPAPSEAVCFSALGGYTVTLPSQVTVQALAITAGANVAFTSSATLLTVRGTVSVAARAGIVLRQAIGLGADSVGVHGELRLKGTSSLADIRALYNTGIVEFDGAPQAYVEHVVNDGDLSLPRPVDVITSYRFQQRTGTIRGDRLKVVQKAGSDTARLVWGGGTLEPRQGASAVLESSLLSVVLESTQLTGALSMTVRSDTLIGNVGAAVTLTVSGTLWSSTFWHRPPLAAPPDVAVQIDGTLRLVSDSSSQLVGGTFHYRAIGPIVNRGRVEAVGNATLGWYLVPHAASFENHGTLVGAGTGSVSLRLEEPAPFVFHNFGSVDSMSTQLMGAEYITMPKSRHNGYVFMYGGVLRGSGYMRSVWVNHGRVAPGTTIGERLPVPQVASLEFDTLTLRDSSEVQLDVVSEQVSDQIIIGDRIDYGGRLLIRTFAGYLASAGTCGQRVPVFIERNGWRSALWPQYPVTMSIPVGTRRAWRVHHADTTYLAGYDPTVSLELPRDVALEEGGGAASYDVCLGFPVQAGTVTVALDGTAGDVRVAPAHIDFTSTNFALPQRVILSAVDDAFGEGPHVDSIVPVVTSAGAPIGPAPRASIVSITDNDPGVDLAISLTSTNNPVTVGQEFERRFRVSNLGLGASTGSVVSIAGLIGATFAGNTAGSDCAMVGTELQCSVGAIPAGGVVEFFVLFTAAVPGTHTNTVLVRGSEWDHVASNDTLTWQLTVQ